MDLMKIHQQCRGNMKYISAGSHKKCGCFYCLSIYEASIIDLEEDYIYDKNGETILCPNCGIDAVLVENNDLIITKELLEKMNQYFF